MLAFPFGHPPVPAAQKPGKYFLEFLDSAGWISFGRYFLEPEHGCNVYFAHKTRRFFHFNVSLSFLS
jgi:hypothetical protein